MAYLQSEVHSVLMPESVCSVIKGRSGMEIQKRKKEADEDL